MTRSAPDAGIAPRQPKRGGAHGVGMSKTSAIRVGRVDTAVVVALEGDFGVGASLRLAGVLNDILDGQGNLDVVIDLHGVEGIDRCGLNAVASAKSSTH